MFLSPLRILGKIKKPHPIIGTRLSSCGTTQVGANAPPRSAYFIRAALVTGAVPVGRYWVKDRSLRPPRAIRRNALCRDSTIRSSLKGSLPGYFSWSQVFLDCFALYASGAPLSTVDLHKRSFLLSDTEREGGPIRGLPLVFNHTGSKTFETFWKPAWPAR